MTERHTIKDLIFTRTLPSYITPVPTDGYKIFPCIDCGEKFIFESSYNHHVNRKSLKITYFCRHCMKVTIFYNRCQFLCHIRCHAFKSATITVTDIKIEPLPLEHFDFSILPNIPDKQASDAQNNTKQVNVCYECNQVIDNLGVTYKDRAAHYMKSGNGNHVCPICMFILPTVCALEAHLRIHLNIPPFFCPECGMHLSNRVVSYPFEHDCKGFKIMKANTRLKCKIEHCKTVFHPNEYNKHFKSHLKQVYRCSYCLELWYNQPQSNCTLCNNGSITSYIRCPICPTKLFLMNYIEKHVNSHGKNSKEKFNDQVYPCMSCNLVFQHMYSLINHHVNTHSSANLKNLLSKVLVKAESEKTQKAQRNVYHRVIKKCSKCLRSFRYRCLYENINSLPNQCPYKCSINSENQNDSQTSEDDVLINCFMCKRKVSQNWSNLKEHYAEFHKNHKCLDINISVKRLDAKELPRHSKNKSRRLARGTKNRFNKLNRFAKKTVSLEATKENDTVKVTLDPYACIICNYNCDDKQNFENHIITHRDPCMAYQCLECGQCFVVKRSFATHLLLNHGINDVEEYIAQKPCYNETAMLKHQTNLNISVEEPLKENQCQICREQFENSDDLEKHFRVHGMAFLIKNAHKNNSP